MRPWTPMLPVCASFSWSWVEAKVKVLAVAAHLAQYQFTLKTSPPSRFNPNLTEPIPEKLTFTPHQASEEWDRGVEYAKAQNLARTVCFLPTHLHSIPNSESFS